MAEQQHLRRSRAGHAGSPPHAHVALLALVAAATSLLLLAATTLFGNTDVSFTDRVVGPSLSTDTMTGRVVTHHASSKTRVTIDRAGAFVTRHGQTVALATAGAGDAAWQTRANGFLRRTPFGREAIVDTGTRAELYLDVSSKVGLRTWRWHLGNVDATLAADGTVALGAGMSVRPPAIYDEHGKTVTPAGTHWTLDRNDGSTDLLLRFDDAHLTAPYTIDPEVDYGSGTSGTVYFTNTLSTYSKGRGARSDGHAGHDRARGDNLHGYRRRHLSGNHGLGQLDRHELRAVRRQQTAGRVDVGTCAGRADDRKSVRIRRRERRQRERHGDPRGQLDIHGAGARVGIE
jgi:hypothetical protein